MEKIPGHWFPAGSSKKLPAQLAVLEGAFALEIASREPLIGNVGTINVSRRIGNIPRKLTFADQSVFESTENDLIDDWLNNQKIDASGAWMHRLESGWKWIALSLIAVIMVTFSGFKWGLPWTSEWVAYHLPESVASKISEGSMDVLDRWFFEPSEIESDVQKKLSRRFDALVNPSSDFSYQLHFRKMGVPNAMALPSGDVVVTDAFVKLATIEEFEAVMWHEIGHVEQRHGLQQLVRSSLISFLVAMILGEPSGVEELIVGLPVFLAQSQYSQGHESEADLFAFERMIESNKDPIHFATIMEKLEHFDVDQPLDSDEVSDEGETKTKKTVLDYFSTHPETANRILLAKEYSQRFKQNQ